MILTQRDIESIKNFEYSKKFDYRYIGLSIWVEKNWIIGPSKTRLSHYFKTKGLKSSIEMTNFVVESYYKYLRNEKFNENKMIHKVKIDRNKFSKVKKKHYNQLEDFDQFQADSIKGQYIPKNLEDCFYYLDKILSEKDILAIKNNEIIDTNIFSIGFCEWANTDLTAYQLSRLSFDILKNEYRFFKTDPCLILEKYRLYLQKGFKSKT